MRTLEYSELITEEVEQLQLLLKKATKPLIRRRLRFLLLLKQNKGMSRAVAGKKLGLLPEGAEAMWSLYHKGGIEKLTDYPFKGKKPRLDEGQKQWLVEKARGEALSTLKTTVKLIEQEQQIHYSVSAVHYIFKALKIKKKTGRPAHIHKDEAKVEAFKKKTFPA
jgi:transposase